jgi:hypothetical protein
MASVAFPRARVKTLRSADRDVRRANGICDEIHRPAGILKSSG